MATNSKPEDTILGQEHVLLEDTHAFDTLLAERLGERVVTVEVLLKRPAHDGAVAVSREGTRQHGHVAKGRLERLVENVGNLVLEVLSGDERVDQVLPAMTQHGVDLTASAAEVLIIVKCLPEAEERLGTGLGTGVEENADFRVQDAAKGREEPAMGVDLLGVTLLQAEHHLDGRERARAVIEGTDQLLAWRHRQLGRVFENVGGGLLAVNIALHDTVLENTERGEQIERALVARVNTVEDEADDNLLPSRAALVPELGLFQVDNIADVLHDTVHGTGSQHLVFVVGGDGDEQLRVAVVHGWA